VLGVVGHVVVVALGRLGKSPVVRPPEGLQQALVVLLSQSPRDLLVGVATVAKRTDAQQALIGQMPRADLEPELGPLGTSNRLYYGKLPTSLQEDLIDIGAAQPAGPAMRVNPRLLLAILATAEHLGRRPTPRTP
jgi:hypothetical protein